MDEFIHGQRTRILLIGSNPDDTLFWEKMLSGAKDEHIEFVPIDRLIQMDHRVVETAPDLVLLDLSQPDLDPLMIFLTVHNAIPAAPVVVAMGSEDRGLALRLLNEGAQDCLVKDRLNAGAVDRITHFVLARQRSLQQLQAFSLVDELTGLYNRRGFLLLAEQQLKLANRTGQSLFLAFVDVDGLKAINDLLGHLRGDLAIIETAHVIKEAFRETDILARLGGDEFVALLVCGEDLRSEALAQKFRSTLEEHNTYGKSDFKLSASIGIAVSEPGSHSSIPELMERADKLMYQQKKSGKRLRFSYQLRFLRTAPIRSWLKSTADRLGREIPEEAWPDPLRFPSRKIWRIEQVLAEELLTVLTRRDLCGTETVCELGCSPALENNSPDRFEACGMLAPVDRYLVEADQDLEKITEKLTQGLVREWPEVGTTAEMIRQVLSKALAAHLYENTHCRRVPLCELAKVVDLHEELRYSGPKNTDPDRKPASR